MRLLLLLFVLSATLTAQSGGRVIVDSLSSNALANDFGEKTTRALSVYLPPDYDADPSVRYPVVYYLHGFLNDHTLTPGMVDVLDYAIAAQKIPPFILVVADNRTQIDGSFYSNSAFGSWEDFLAYDLVGYMDETYRTLPARESRGITGHSMGGYGALKLAMRHPEIFSSVYALSPGALAIVGEYGPNSNTFRELAAIEDMDGMMKSYFPKVMVAFGRAWSPNPDNPPFYVDLPFEYVRDSLVTHPEVLARWQEELPVHMIEGHLDALHALTAIKFDWGRNAGTRFTRQCEMFSQRLENAGVTHYAEEYIGTHTSDIFTRHGRVATDMLPFFADYLSFEPTGTGK
ncbi:alpha/beta hydrolase [Lewinella sp. IMCC34183]|uniref:alpha/beta hydrolase n=1 Tax=Lewinella sp. IMCC34183 TaxID=2248762 RepID=UPI000E2638A2|nr:alpha/beta hydrolase-fold protein [Lewinella sp. IMCC34183]